MKNLTKFCDAVLIFAAVLLIAMALNNRTDDQHEIAGALYHQGMQALSLL